MGISNIQPMQTTFTYHVQPQNDQMNVQQNGRQTMVYQQDGNNMNVNAMNVTMSDHHQQQQQNQMRNNMNNQFIHNGMNGVNDGHHNNQTQNQMMQMQAQQNQMMHNNLQNNANNNMFSVHHQQRQLGISRISTNNLGQSVHQQTYVINPFGDNDSSQQQRYDISHHIIVIYFSLFIITY